MIVAVVLFLPLVDRSAGVAPDRQADFVLPLTLGIEGISENGSGLLDGMSACVNGRLVLPRRERQFVLLLVPLDFTGGDSLDEFPCTVVEILGTLFGFPPVKPLERNA